MVDWLDRNLWYFLAFAFGMLFMLLWCVYWGTDFSDFFNTSKSEPPEPDTEGR